MPTLYVATIHTKLSSGSIKPKIVGIRIGGTTKIFKLFVEGEEQTLFEINQNIKKIQKIILKSNDVTDIVINNFYQSLEDFELPLDTREYNVYSHKFYKLEKPIVSDKDYTTINRVLDAFETVSKKPYQKLQSNAAVVYKFLENRGILQNYSKQHPEWSLDTWSGRSKCLNFNVQGWHENDHIRPPNSLDSDVLIHFDWICADIRVAALLSGDKLLEKSFQHSDPYKVMEILINKNSDEKITRDECKLFLLKSINSFDVESQALSEIYRGLGKWIYKQLIAINRQENLQSILGKTFKLDHAKNKKAILNGVMQGSVAHAMQNTIRRVWEKLPDGIVTEIHDSLVMSCNNEPATIKSTIKVVADIMTRPFKGYLDSNPFFPIKVSVGPRWKEWEHKMTFLEDKVIYAERQEEDNQKQDCEDRETEEEEEAKDREDRSLHGSSSEGSCGY